MTILIALLIAPLAVLTFCFALEIYAGLKPLPAAAPSGAIDFSAVIVVPAHDEERVLRSSLERLKDAAAGLGRILLVADNCTDATARLGKELGVEVIERSDASRKGKGFALDFARTYLSSDPPDVVLIVDADCVIDAASLAHLIGCCVSTARPCQATNLQRPALEASPAVQLSTFAFFVKNVIRQRALKRLVGSVQLLGTGMAIPWDIFAQAELATNSIVEDLKLGQELADAGHGPVFVDQAVIWSRAETDANTISQRRRWEGGFLQNAVRAGPPRFIRALRRADLRLLWSSIDTVIPPFSLLILLDIVAAAVAAGLTWLFAAQVWPLICLCGALLTALVALGCAWARGGSQFVSLRSLARAPLYVAWKLPMYLSFARHGAPKEWSRTSR